MFPQVEKNKSAIWEQRRKFEEERRLRILDPKKRQIGVDVKALTEQVANRRRREEEARRKEEEADLSMVASDLSALSIDKKRQEEMRIYYRKMEDFWRQQEMETKSRRSERSCDYQEWDEPGPSSAKRNSFDHVFLPQSTNVSWIRSVRNYFFQPKKHENEATVKCSSFTGEDHELRSRSEMQKQQQRLWLTNQLAERRAMSERELNLQRKSQAWETQLRNKATLLQQAEERAKRQLEMATARFNREKAAENVNETHRKKMIEQAWNLEEQEATAWSDLMTEDSCASEAGFHVQGIRSRSQENFHARPKTAAGNLRVRVNPVDRFKGLPPEDVAQFRLWQCEQMQKKQELERKNRREELNWAQEERQRIDRRMKAMEDMARRKQEYLKGVAEENLRMAQQQRVQQARINAEFTKHVASDDFYTKFQTSSR